MKRFETACLQSDAKTLVEELQRTGALHIERYEDDRFTDMPSQSSVAVYEKSLDTVENAIGVLSSFGSVGNTGMFSERTDIETSEFELFASRADKCMQEAYEILRIKKNFEDANAEIVRCRTQIESLSIWKKLDVPMHFSGTETTRAFIGTVPGEKDREAIVTELSKLTPELSEYEVQCVYTSKEVSAFFVLCHKAVEKDVYSALRQLGFIAVQENGVESVNERLLELEERITQCQKDAEQCKNALAEKCKNSADLLLLYDYLSVKCDEYKNLSGAKLTDKTIILCGYVSQRACDAVEKIAAKYACAVSFSEPSEDEDVPVLLKNNKFCEPVEGITEMYALPGKHDIDPSSVMAFFYYLLFGMMLSDAGYGVVMTLGTAFILWKTNVEGSMRKMLKMFFFCGLSTTFWGALFGSWFGDIIPVICENFLGYETKPNLALWFDPIADPMKLLLFSFVIGICHLFLGLITFGVIQWKAGNRISAIFDTVPTILLVLGAVPLAGSILTPMPKIAMEIGKYLAIAGVILVVLTTNRSSKNIIAKLGGGLYGLYNVASGYLSDILSYSRLLALGLATGSIASVVNMIGVMPEGKVMKAVMLVVVFCIGHPLNMAINVLGAYVHANRLQFVELFSKFYEGGGRAFQPLKINTKYFKLKEEIKND